MRPFAGARTPAAPSSSAHGTVVNPANIKKVVRELPPNYEVTTGIPTAVSPRVIWSRDADGTVKPAQCATLADPGDGRDQAAQGMSGSGAGGVIDAIVVSLPAAGESLTRMSSPHVASGA